MAEANDPFRRKRGYGRQMIRYKAACPYCREQIHRCICIKEAKPEPVQRITIDEPFTPPICAICDGSGVLLLGTACACQPI